MGKKKDKLKQVVEKAKQAVTDLVSMHDEGFAAKVTPKKTDDLSLLKCAGCGGVHFRHAGYVHMMLPFIKPGGDKRVALEDHQVKVCVACKRSFIWIDQQAYDVTDKIDLKAWEKTEKEAHKATGPGGDC